MVLRKVLFALLAAASLAAALLWLNGSGHLGRQLGSGEITAVALRADELASRTDAQSQYAAQQPAGALPPVGKQILFGDLHVHTSYSFDVYLSDLPNGEGIGVSRPADPCALARYCSAVDFWSINDHAESLTPRTWSDTIESIRQCNRVGIHVAGNYIIGHPDETIEEIYTTVRMAKRHVEQGLNHAALFALVPFPGTQVTRSSSG